MANASLTASMHMTRARRHEHIADALSVDEWAAVPYFYAAYHIVRCALIEDPIFDDIDRLHATHLDLIPPDRHTGRHKGRKNSSAGREWGVNELVALLYPRIVSEYERLHQASIAVRYGSGLKAPIPSLRADLTTIIGAYNNGQLTA